MGYNFLSGTVATDLNYMKNASLVLRSEP